MRPKRILRRFVARARHWGRPHVHCPGCGADASVPESTEPQICFTCKIEWFRHELSGDPEADRQAIDARIPAGRAATVVWNPILVDVIQADGRNISTPIDCAFVYFSETKP